MSVDIKLHVRVTSARCTTGTIVMWNVKIIGHRQRVLLKHSMQLSLMALLISPKISDVSLRNVIHKGVICDQVISQCHFCIVNNVQ